MASPSCECLLALPDESLVLILSHLDGASLVRMKTVCRRICNLFERFKLLQYLVELYISGMIEGSGGYLISVGERLRRLRQFQHNWTTLSGLKRETGPIVTVCGNVCMMIRIESLGTETLILDFKKFPVGLRSVGASETESESWTLQLPSYSDMQMDSTQGLFVGIEEQGGFSLNLLCLTTGESHPLATKVRLTQELPPFYTEEMDEGIQILDDLICYKRSVRTQGVSTYFDIWDWKMGLMKMSVHDDSNSIRACSLLSSRYLMLGTSGDMSDAPEGRPRQRVSLIICDIEQTATIQKTNPNAFVYTCELHFPALEEDYLLFTMNITASPLSRRDAADVVFFPAPSSRVILIDLNVVLRRSFRDSTELRFVIWYESLLRFIHSKENCEPKVVFSPHWHERSSEVQKTPPLTPRSGELIIPWSEWGPQSCRLILFPSRYDDPKQVVCGSRLVNIHHRTDGIAKVQIFDFNPRVVKRGPHQAEEQSEETDTDDDDYKVKITRAIMKPLKSATLVAHAHSTPGAIPGNIDIYYVTSPTVIPRDILQIFEVDLETRAPFRWTDLELDYRLSGAFLTEDYLITV